ncbi:MAG: outer membrane protein assembly factor BamE [Rhodocyclaceae bacterium]|nr:outer membrane protein assembly factor BamE [Rhodocyclaceae bacterium]
MKRLLVLVATPFLLSCSGLDGVTSYLRPFRIDVRQGNLVTQEMVAQLKPGQTREQVRFILGTPLVMDIFHADRWDYVYRFQSGRDDQEFQQRRLVVYFEDGKLTRLDGDVVASRGEADAGSVVAKPATRVIDIKSAEGTAK